MSDLETTVDTPQAEPGSGNLDSIISDAIKQHEPAAEDAPVKTEAAPAEGGEQDQKVSGERPRDPATGKFAKKDSATDEAPETGPAKTEATPAKTEGADTAATQPIEPPAMWSAADKATFAKLPRETQQILVDRTKAMEADYTRKTQELAETRKTFEPVHQELGRWDGYLRQLGIAPHQAINQMLTVEYNLRNGSPEQKQQALAYLADLYGANLPASNSGEPNAENPAQGDPHYQQLSRMVTDLSSQLRQMQTNSAANERQRAEAEFNALGQTKDPNGQPKYPHFEKVKQSMIQMVASGQADSWENAYSKSIRLDDELYNQIVEDERKAVAEKLEKERREAVEKAKNARPVKTSTSMTNGSTASADLDSIISGAMAKAGI